MASLGRGTFSLLRTKTGAPVAVDAGDPSERNAINCSGYDTILVYPKLTGGGAGDTVTITPWLYDPAQDVWIKDAAVAAKTTLQVFEINCRGLRVYPYISAITGTSTQLDLYVAGGVRAAE